MKILCDVCDKDEASVFCTADEAALCDACDHNVHHANKLASKHQRFSLLHPSSQQFPLCDICQDRRAFLFCQQDRAIMCKDCDLSIHIVNEHTKRHNRFLLAGVKLSATSDVYTSSSVPNVSDPNKKSIHSSDISVVISSCPALSVQTAALPTTSVNIDVEGCPTSSISEYLLETLPGWHVEDLLSPFGLPKIDEGMSPFVENDYGSDMNPFSTDIWVPQAPQKLLPLQDYSSHTNGQMSVKEIKKDVDIKANQRWNDDGCLVPHITNSPSTNKRQRCYWQN